MAMIEQWLENLPTIVHKPRGYSDFERGVLKGLMGAREGLGSSRGHGSSASSGFE